MANKKNKMSKEEQEKFITQLQSVLSKKPIVIRKKCQCCGAEYAVDTSDDESTLCLPCQVKKDMHLSDDVIINRNILNIWKAGRYDKEKGISPFLCAVAEGIMLLPDIGDARNHLSVISSKKVKISDEEMTRYIPKLIEKSEGKYDAIVFVRFQPNDNFSIFTVRLSNRLVRILSKCNTIKIKSFIFNLVVKHVLKQKTIIEKQNKKSKK